MAALLRCAAQWTELETSQLARLLAASVVSAVDSAVLAVRKFWTDLLDDGVSAISLTIDSKYPVKKIAFFNQEDKFARYWCKPFAENLK